MKHALKHVMCEMVSCCSCHPHQDEQHAYKNTFTYACICTHMHMHIYTNLHTRMKGSTYNA